MRTRVALSQAAGLTLGAFVLAGCASAPAVEKPPVATPRVASSVACRAGSPLGAGTGAGEVALVGSGLRADPQVSLQVVVSFVALEKIPENLLGPLSAQTRLLAAPQGERAIVAEAALFTGACAEVVNDATSFASRLEARANRFADLRAALPRGITASFELGRDHSPGETGEGLRESLAVHVARRTHANAPDSLDVAIELVAPLAGHQEGRDEIAVLDVRPLGVGEGLAAIVPSPFDGDEARAIGVVVSVLPPPSDEGPGAAAHRRACVECTADLAREEALRREGVRAPRPMARIPAERSGTGLPRPDLRAAMRALASESSRRGGLFALAQATGAPLTEDLALSADDAVLASVCPAVARAVTAPDVPASGAALGWIVERGTLEGLRLFVGDRDAPPRLTGLLVRQAGAPGRSCALLFGLVEGARDLADFDQRLRAENRGLLEDGSPALRSSAFEWLEARGLAPAGYAPLAPADERRAALDRAAAESKRGAP